MIAAWLGLAFAAETDCVTKDLTWRWLQTTEGAKPGDRWVHGTTVLAEAGGASRVTWKADEASKVVFRTGASVETFKWKVTVTASDGKAIGGGVSETTLDLTMHCQKSSGAAPVPAAVKATPAPKAAEPAKPAEAAKPAEPAKAPAPK